MLFSAIRGKDGFCIECKPGEPGEFCTRRSSQFEVAQLRLQFTARSYEARIMNIMIEVNRHSDLDDSRRVRKHWKPAFCSVCCRQSVYLQRLTKMNWIQKTLVVKITQLDSSWLKVWMPRGSFRQVSQVEKPMPVLSVPRSRTRPAVPIVKKIGIAAV